MKVLILVIVVIIILITTIFIEKKKNKKEMLLSLSFEDEKENIIKGKQYKIHKFISPEDRVDNDKDFPVCIGEGYWKGQVWYGEIIFHNNIFVTVKNGVILRRIKK